MKRRYTNSFQTCAMRLLLILCLSLLSACAKDSKKSKEIESTDRATEQLPQLSFESTNDGSLKEIRTNEATPRDAELNMNFTSGQSLQLQNKELNLTLFNGLRFTKSGDSWNIESMISKGGRLKISTDREVLNLSLLTQLESPSKISLNPNAQIYILSLTKESFLRAVVRVHSLNDDNIEISYKVFEDGKPHSLELDEFVLDEGTVQTIKLDETKNNEKIMLPIDSENPELGKLPLGFKLKSYGQGRLQILATDAWFPGTSGVFQLPYQSSLDRLSQAEHFAYSGSFRGSSQVDLDSVYILRLENLYERVLLAVSFYEDPEGNILMQYKIQAVYN